MFEISEELTKVVIHLIGEGSYNIKHINIANVVHKLYTLNKIGDVATNEPEDKVVSVECNSKRKNTQKKELK